MSRHLGWMLLGMMLLVAWLGQRLQPVPGIVQSKTPARLETLTPSHFGAWQLLEQDPGHPQRSTELQQKVASAYQQTLERVYTRADGERVMLSMAYGSNQFSDALQVHRPEYCYKAQGYQIEKSRDVKLRLADSHLQVRRLLATKPGRQEPITYWVTVGDDAVLPGVQRKLAQMRYGLRGEIPDGMLVRISTISQNEKVAYEVHLQFLQDWLHHLAAQERARLIGRQQV